MRTTRISTPPSTRRAFPTCRCPRIRPKASTSISNTTGLVDNLRIEVVGDDVSYPIALVGVEINARHPFDFNMVRFFAVAGMLALVYVFRPRSAIYRIGIVQDPKKSKAGIVAAVGHRGMPGGLVFVHWDRTWWAWPPKTTTTGRGTGTAW